MIFKHGVTLIRYKRKDGYLYDVRVERIFEGLVDGLKRTDYVYIPVSPQVARLLDGIQIRTETIKCLEERENEDE